MIGRFFFLIGALFIFVSAPATASSPISATAIEAAEKELVAAHGDAEAERIRRGVAQTARFWRAEDGDEAAFHEFVTAEFLPRGDELDRTFNRFGFLTERVGGYLNSMVRDLRRYALLDLEPMLPIDHRLAAWNPGAHIAEDYFATKVAFIALLNFPLTTLEEKLEQGDAWTRREWAQTRLAGRFDQRVPSSVRQTRSAAYAAADNYINGYNIWMRHLLTEDGRRLFPDGLRLISHWGLRDEIRARYGDPEALPKQRMIADVLDRIVRQTIPAAVINEPRLDWTPATGAVTPSPIIDFAPDAVSGPAPAPETAREPDTRYEHWRSVFAAEHAADQYSPDYPTFIDRRFKKGRELPEAKVEALLKAVLSSPLSAEVGALVSERLGRPLEPFDIWYIGFKPGGAVSENELSAMTRSRYPDAAAFAADIPRMLKDLGFAPDKASFLSERIVVEPSRGVGHAWGPERRDDNAHLRTRIASEGMDYKGYNIAIHELGHNVEQVFSNVEIDYTLLQGVPNVAFTEALAFIFQDADLRLLGLAEGGAEVKHLNTLQSFWSTREIAGVALVDMKVWRWLYDNPDATAAELREAVIMIAEDVWNEYFADIFGAGDQVLLAVYSHMIDTGMYTPDYPLGRLIAFQVTEYFANSEASLGVEFERMSLIGDLTPDAWMRHAVGAPVSAEPLLSATERALSAKRR